MSRLNCALIVSSLFAHWCFADNICPGTCNRGVSGPNNHEEVTSPCHPGNYQNDLSCPWSPPYHNNTYMQITMNFFIVEAWNDYLRLDGSQNFLLFVNSSTSEVIITGYPISNITAAFMTDSSISYSGFNFTFRSIPEDALLEQYTAYSNVSGAQVLRSPLFISSNGDLEDSSSRLDIMFINIPNDTNSAAEAWTLYTGVLAQTARVQPFNITATGFSVNWTRVGGSFYYRVNVSDLSGQTRFSKELNGTHTTFDGLPSGTDFIINVTIVNKRGDSIRITGNARTEFMSPVDFNAQLVDQTSFRLSWKLIDGSTSYQINVNGSIYISAISPFVVEGLSPGRAYAIEIRAIYAAGKSDLVRIIQRTVPGNVTLELNSTSTTVTASWLTVFGADSYTLSMTNNATTNNETFDSAQTEYEIPHLNRGTTYKIFVVAINSAGESHPVVRLFTTVLDPPGNLEIVSITKTRFLLRWEKTSGAMVYKYKCSDTNSVLVTENTVKETSIFVTGLSPNTAYMCSVVAQSPDTESLKASASATTANSECEKSPCLYEGTCRELEEDFECTCADGRTGKVCQNVFDWCASETCARNSTCTNSIIQLRAVCTCNQGFTGDPKKRCIAFCNPANITKENETLSFNSTYSGLTAYSNQRCNKTRSIASAVCTTSSLGEGRMSSGFDRSSVVVVKCKLSIEDVTIQVNTSSTDISADKLETQTAQLQVLTSGETLTEDEAENVADYIVDVGKIAEKNNEAITTTVFTGIVNTAANLISSQSVTLSQPTPAPVTNSPGQIPPTTKPSVSASQKEKEIKQKILKSLTVLAEQVKLPNDTKEIEIETKSMIVKVVERTLTKPPEDATTPPPGAWFSPIFTGEHAQSPSELNTNMIQPLNISIPYSALLRTEDSGKSPHLSGKPLRLSFFMHKDDTLFPSDKSPEMIVSANLGINLTLTDLEDKVKIKYNDIKEKPGKRNSSKPLFSQIVGYQCVYWDFSSGSWSPEGCCLDRRDGNLSTCECDHLTNYALLVSKDEVPADVALEIVSDVGLYLSMAGLLSTIIIHCLREEVRKRRPTQILLHVCFNLFGSYLIFVVGISLTTNKGSCVAVAALLQYFFLASWCWMAVYANDMYRSLVLVFNTNKTRYMTKCALFAYGFPLLMTSFNVGVAVGHFDANSRPENLCPAEGVYDRHEVNIPAKSVYIANNMCWLHEYSLYFGFLLPIGLMLVFNTFVYSMVMKTLLERGDKLQSSAKKTTAKDNLLISITLSASTGLSWILGYLMLLSDDETYLLVMSWIFALSNTLQGLVIFLTTCVRHENMRKIWWGPISNCFSSSIDKIRMLSPKREEFNLGNTSETAGSFTSTSGGTRSTAVRSISAKGTNSESTI